MSFYILKSAYPKDRGLIWDIFKLDSFNRNLELTEESINLILSEFNGELAPREVEIHALLSQELFKNMGGTKDTPIEEVAAFFYVLYNTPNFSFKEYEKIISHSIFIDNSFRYFQEQNIVVPFQYIVTLKTTLKDARIFEMISKRHIFTIDTSSSIEEADKFFDTISNYIVDYYKRESNVLDQINRIINN